MFVQSLLPIFFQYFAQPSFGLRCKASQLSSKKIPPASSAALVDGSVEVEVVLRPGAVLDDVTANVDVDVPRNEANAQFWSVVDGTVELPKHDLPENATREVMLLNKKPGGEFFVALVEASKEFDKLKADLKSLQVRIVTL